MSPENKFQPYWKFVFFFLFDCAKKILFAVTELCLQNLNALSSIGLIQMDKDINIKPTGKRTISLNTAVSCYLHSSASHFTSSMHFCSVQRLEG